MAAGSFDFTEDGLLDASLISQHPLGSRCSCELSLAWAQKLYLLHAAVRAP